MRRAIQNSKESLKKLSEKYSVNKKTLSTSNNINYGHATPIGPKNPHSTVLSREEEAMCVAFRKHTLLPLDDLCSAIEHSVPYKVLIAQAFPTPRY
jgi:hypothetical protein